MKRKPTRLATWLLSGLCAFAAVSCTGKKDEIQPEPAQKQDLVAVTYAQTQCNDRWGQAQGTQQLVAKAQAYLAQQGLTLNQPQASVAGPPAVCAACTCPTGLVLEATVSPADLPAVLALGFAKK
ncbi:hypothetical protein [Hymenobacter ruricola]|uniref:Lipoprotein n=1 Tax=Hymenobacter ruricola TaxID=2791023 RepID=A0ABS0I9B5_9BACT|nr:hypothetical protein [Hymenobacter ruricola]MBF9223530.1 hypothetical protein [Hymenobacter ruricola]